MDARTGYDWILLDTEHSPTGPMEVFDQLLALDRASAEVTSAVVRPPWNDPVQFKKLLDIGVCNLVVLVQRHCHFDMTEFSLSPRLGMLKRKRQDRGTWFSRLTTLLTVFISRWCPTSPLLPRHSELSRPSASRLQECGALPARRGPADMAGTNPTRESLPIRSA